MKSLITRLYVTLALTTIILISLSSCGKTEAVEPLKPAMELPHDDVSYTEVEKKVELSIKE